MDMNTLITNIVKLLELIYIVSKVLGAFAIVLGIWELLLEQENNYKTKDLLNSIRAIIKIIGGVLLLLISKLLDWILGGIQLVSSLT